VAALLDLAEDALDDIRTVNAAAKVDQPIRFPYTTSPFLL